MATGDWVLVVDDDQDVRDMISLALGLYGVRSEGAVDGLEALELLDERPAPGVILLDLRMPRCSGEEFVSQLRRNPHHAHLPVLFLSGDADAIRLSRAGFVQGYLPKPVELDALIAAVRPFLPSGADATTAAH